MQFYSIRPYLSWGLMITAIFGVIYLGYLQGNQSNILKLATGERGSYEHQVGLELKKAIEARSDFNVELVASGDSNFNRSLLQANKADIAIMSPAVSSFNNLAAIAPISENVLHVIARMGSGIDTITDLSGRRIAMGDAQSDDRQLAIKMLEHYHVDSRTVRAKEVEFERLLDSNELDGAVISASTHSEFLKTLLKTGQFYLIRIDANEGIANANTHVVANDISVGAYASVDGPLPANWTPSIVNQGIFVTKQSAPAYMVETFLDVLYSKQSVQSYPVLADFKVQDGVWLDLESHPAAVRFFNPYGALKTTFYDALLSLWHVKYWVLCVVVLVLTLRSRIKAHRQSRITADNVEKLRRMQLLLEEINEHENLQAQTKDYRLLVRRLEEARKIKQDGLAVGTELDMLDSHVFVAFMQQCDHVIREIQNKLNVGMHSASTAAAL